MHGPHPCTCEQQSLGLVAYKKTNKPEDMKLGMGMFRGRRRLEGVDVRWNNVFIVYMFAIHKNKEKRVGSGV